MPTFENVAQHQRSRVSRNRVSQVLQAQRDNPRLYKYCDLSIKRCHIMQQDLYRTDKRSTTGVL